MSVYVSKWVWDQHLPAPEKLVLLCLADHARHDGTKVYPSVATVQRMTGISDRQVQRYLKSFVERGILTITANEAGGRGRAREYAFQQFIDAEKGDVDVTLSKRVTSGERVTPEPERVTPEALKGDIAVSPQPLEPREPSIPKTPEPKKPKPLPENGPSQQIVKVYCEAFGIDHPVGYGTLVGQASQLVKAGFSPGDVAKMIAWLKNDAYWSSRGIDMGTIVRQANRWKAAKTGPAALKRKVV